MAISGRCWEALSRYWAVCLELRQTLFKERRLGYFDLAVDKSTIKPTIYEHPEFAAFIADMNAHFGAWRKKSAATLKALQAGRHPKEIIVRLSEELLAHYVGKPFNDAFGKGPAWALRKGWATPSRTPQGTLRLRP